MDERRQAAKAAMLRLVLLVSASMYTRETQATGECVVAADAAGISGRAE
ncbi:MAG: hypothetical protein PUP91_06975 [Rhizonema sp. PD37]|nr:hypothetical protein [Rhizonema sp. PD37]